MKDKSFVLERRVGAYTHTHTYACSTDIPFHWTRSGNSNARFINKTVCK